MHKLVLILWGNCAQPYILIGIWLIKLVKTTLGLITCRRLGCPHSLWMSSQGGQCLLESIVSLHHSILFLRVSCSSQEQPWTIELLPLVMAIDYFIIDFDWRINKGPQNAYIYIDMKYFYKLINEYGRFFDVII